MMEFPRKEALKKFTQSTYQILEENFSSLPIRFQNFFPHMKTHDWLFNYQYKEGLQKSLGGLVHRALYLTDASEAFTIFNNHHEELKDCYQTFFPAVKKFAAAHLHHLSLA